jgi:RHH-type proline utilization regulon transcriptional repressor/proline dehydrogenase/delta 1-pyrroline-5-carboxylate dehydrogenase
MNVAQISIPQEKQPVNEWVNSLTCFLEKIELTTEQLGIWYASIANYAYWWKRMSMDRDPTKIIGQDNLFRYIPRKNIALRIESHSKPLDALRVCAAALTVGAGLELSWSTETASKFNQNWLHLIPVLHTQEESSEEFFHRVQKGTFQRVRLVEHASQELKEALAASGTNLIDQAVLANGRIELLHYLREVSISIDYHRYGNLGLREGELRKPIL